MSLLEKNEEMLDKLCKDIFLEQQMKEINDRPFRQKKRKKKENCQSRPHITNDIHQAFEGSSETCIGALALGAQFKFVFIPIKRVCKP